jgi:hypothetical protein
MPGLLPKNTAQIKQKIPIYKVYFLGGQGIDLILYSVWLYN